LKWLSIVDEYTRECLALEVDRSITAEKVIDVLAELFRIRGVPKHIRSDNGPEFIAKVIRRWLSLADVETLYVEPGLPWENGYAESFHSRLRDELTNREEFTNLAEARYMADAWQLEYNHRRAAQFLGLPDPGGVCRRLCCCFRAAYGLTPAAAQPEPQRFTITRYPINTLITPGTENGGRSVQSTMRPK
jgi:transposase InsO family protein